jgi:2-C-methyl-D-erythritol 4-phosphate cytidylyltransferase/2-C-methyl-D-erythritol 2,4-cyclodiphosphate synthase
MLADAGGHGVAIVPGDEGNMKITTPADLAAAKNRVEPSVSRVGTGYDLHRLVEGRPLVLAGVTLSPIVVSQSFRWLTSCATRCIDAMFGAAAAGDIGRHFPNTDPIWKDAAGLDLLEKATGVLDGLGWTVSNVDVTVILEGSETHAQRAGHSQEPGALCSILPLEAGHVKAKTNEGVDAVGRGEAIAAHCRGDGSLLSRAALK